MLEKLRYFREKCRIYKKLSENRDEALSISESEVSRLNADIKKLDSKLTAFSKKNSQLEALLQEEIQHKNAARRDLESKEMELSAAIGENISLRAAVRKLQIDLEMASDKIAVLEQGARFYDTQNQTLQKALESMLATMSGHETYGGRPTNLPEQAAT